jgi:DnaJ-class molecular chaperone
MSGLLIVAILAGFGYPFALHVHPYTRCHSCKGIGRHHGVVYGYAIRGCASCGGKGRQLPFGVCVFLGGTEKK